jgi:hypothetical protein
LSQETFGVESLSQFTPLLTAGVLSRAETMRLRILTLALVASLSAISGVALAQPPVHYLHRADMPPGEVGQRQLMRGGPLAGYFQPVEVIAPKGAIVSLAVEGGFDQGDKDSVLAGMQIGYVYRLRVANIPDHEGEEVFPTIELVDRLYPPPGQAARFPVPVELTAEEIALALEGRFVTRVIYLEQPKNALPVRDEPKKQRYFEIGAGQDPLKVADQMGRPIAILRMGSRVPDGLTTDGKFFYHSPPLLKYTTTPVEVKRNEGLEEAQLPPKVEGRQSANFKRLPESQIRRR